MSAVRKTILLPVSVAKRLECEAQRRNKSFSALVTELIQRQSAAGKARAVKAEANAVCWRFAARPALGVGTSLNISTANGVSTDVIENTAVTYEHYPQDPAVRVAYASVLLAHGMDQFLQQQNILWPKNTVDVRGINALLGYCHAFLHYAGDIRKTPLPLQDVQPAQFLPDPRHTSSQ